MDNRISFFLIKFYYSIIILICKFLRRWRVLSTQVKKKKFMNLKMETCILDNVKITFEKVLVLKNLIMGIFMKDFGRIMLNLDKDNINIRRERFIKVCGRTTKKMV